MPALVVPEVATTATTGVRHSRPALVAGPAPVNR